MSKRSPHVFISWSGRHSHQVAIAFREWLPQVVPGIECWCSSEDTEKGVRWFADLSRVLEDARVGIICLNRSNQDAPWLLFEAGAIAKQLEEGRVCTHLLDLGPEELAGPLSQFQASETTKEDIRRLLLTVNRSLGSRASGERVIESRLDSQWRSFARRLLSVRRRAMVGTRGKTWAKASEDALRDYLRTHDPGGHEQILRILSYTGETTAPLLPEYIDRFAAGDGALKIRVLLRSEYAGFPSRSSDKQFNRLIRWRITRTKSQWYQWIERRDPNETNPRLVTLEIRGYHLDPSAKALILGDSSSFFGLYTRRLKQVSGHQEVGPAEDWVAAETEMAYLVDPIFTRNLVSWFDDVWHESKPDTTESFRCSLSRRLWYLTGKKSEEEKRFFLPMLEKLGPIGDLPQVHNLALPAFHPERTDVVDFMACAVESTSNPGRGILVCEIRNPGELWQGIGKTATYLELVGAQLALPAPETRLSPADLRRALARRGSGRLVPEWRTAGAQAFRLFASDFVWLWRQHGRPRLAPSEGELLWGLWDCARYLLRASLADYRPGFERTAEGRDLQETLYLRIPSKPLIECYTASPYLEPELVVILVPSGGALRLRSIETREARDLLSRAMGSAPLHPSRFWKRDGEGLARHNQTVSRIIFDDFPHATEDSREVAPEFPRTVVVEGEVPFGSVARLIAEVLASSRM